MLRRRKLIVRGAAGAAGWVIAGAVTPTFGAAVGTTSSESSKPERRPTMPFELMKLPYPVDALEPHIDARTMEIHHGKHHATYVNNLNAALEKAPSLQGKTLEELLSNLAAVPEDIRTAVRNNGGGVLNHNLFWQMMTPKSPGRPVGELAKAIEQAFGSFDRFREEFQKAALGRFGSGWAWLVIESGQLRVGSTPNQDAPIMKGISELTGHVVLGIDVWEHAYYLKYQNRRADYVTAWWNVVNWDFANELYRQAVRG